MMRVWLSIMLLSVSLSGYAQSVKSNKVDYSSNNQLGQVQTLSLLQYYLIDADFDTQPSGLALCQDSKGQRQLLMVSDKVDHRIFQINAQLQESGQAIATLSPFVKLTAIPGKTAPYPMNQQSKLARLRQLVPGLRYDWEGIACDDDYFYLASETMIDVLRVDRSGQSLWLNTNTYAAAKKHGLFTQSNAYLEAIGLTDMGELVLGAERQARGLITLLQTENQWLHDVNTQLASPIKPPAEYRLPDLTGLAFYNGFLYTLERNAHLVCQRTLITYRSVNCWSYASAENDPVIRYADDKFGLAEGLAIGEDYIYIVLDNNGQSRLVDDHDTRATLLVFNTPVAIKASQ